MKFLPICIVFLACLVLKGNSDAILCYECDDCGDLSDTQLVSCPLPVTTTEPTPSTTDAVSTEPVPTDPTSTDPVPTDPLPTDPSPTDPSSTDPSPTDPDPTEPSEPQSGPKRKRDVANIPYQSSRQLRSLRSILRAEPTYECYSLEKVDGGSRKVKKGCVEVPDTKEACETIKAQLGGTIENCNSCNTSKCNSSAGLKLSLATFFIALVIGVIYK